MASSCLFALALSVGISGPCVAESSPTSMLQAYREVAAWGLGIPATELEAWTKDLDENIVSIQTLASESNIRFNFALAVVAAEAHLRDSDEQKVFAEAASTMQSLHGLLESNSTLDEVLVSYWRDERAVRKSQHEANFLEYVYKIYNGLELLAKEAESGMDNS